MMSIGPRFFAFESTFASDQGLKFAAAAWKRGSPGPGTEKSAYSSFASSSPTAFAKLYRNWSYVSGTARFQFAGFFSATLAARSADTGNGSTPRNGAGLI